MPFNKQGRKYATGSEHKYGGWEKKTCVVCGEKTLLAHGTAMWCNHAVYGPFTVCREHGYREGIEAASRR